MFCKTSIILKNLRLVNCSLYNYSVNNYIKSYNVCESQYIRSSNIFIPKIYYSITKSLSDTNNFNKPNPDVQFSKSQLLHLETKTCLETTGVKVSLVDVPHEDPNDNDFESLQEACKLQIKEEKKISVLESIPSLDLVDELGEEFPATFNASSIVNK